MTGSADKRALLEKADQKRPVWGVGTIPSALGADFVAATQGAVKQPPTAVTGWAELGEGVQVDVELFLADAPDALALADFAKQQLEALGMMAQAVGLEGVVNKVKIEQDDKIVRASLALDKRELEELEQRLEVGSDEPTQDVDPIDTKEGNEP